MIKSFAAKKFIDVIFFGLLTSPDYPQLFCQKGTKMKMGKTCFQKVSRREISLCDDLFSESSRRLLQVL